MTTETKSPKQRRAEYMRDWRARNLDKARESCRQSYRKHRAKRLAQNRLYRKLNRAKKRAYDQAWRKANAVAKAASDKAWAHRNPGRRKHYYATYRTRHLERSRANGRAAAQRQSRNLTDSYVRSSLLNNGWSPDQITPELMGLQRANLKLKRLCRKLKA
jgi:hypothetical protein